MAEYELIPNVIRGPWRSYDDGPPDVWHLAQGGPLPGKIWFRLAMSEDGRADCTELRIDADRPLTTSVLRAIPLTRIVTDFIQRPFTEDERGGPMDLRTRLRMFYDMDNSILDQLTDQQARAAYLSNSGLTPRRRRSRGGVGPSALELQKFGDIYAWARNNSPRSPVKTTAELMNITRATAHRWLKLIKEGESHG